MDDNDEDLRLALLLVTREEGCLPKGVHGLDLFWRGEEIRVITTKSVGRSHFRICMAFVLEGGPCTVS